MMKYGKFDTHQGADGQWFWHLKAPNGKVIADGAEGYTRKADAERAIARVRCYMHTAEVSEAVVRHDQLYGRRYAIKHDLASLRYIPPGSWRWSQIKKRA